MSRDNWCFSTLRRIDISGSRLRRSGFSGASWPTRHRVSPLLMPPPPLILPPLILPPLILPPLILPPLILPPLILPPLILPPLIPPFQTPHLLSWR